MTEDERKDWLVAIRFAQAGFAICTVIALVCGACGGPLPVTITMGIAAVWMLALWVAARGPKSEV